MNISKKNKQRLIALGIVALVASVLTGMYYWTRAERESMQCFVALMNAANQGDLEKMNLYCTQDYLKRQPLELAPEGGAKNIPRGIDKNFQVWRSGASVRVCPTNRVGPVYQFKHEQGRWKFDGVIGILRPGGRILPVDPQSQIVIPSES